MKNVVNNWKRNFDAVRADESGDIVQTILIIALFVVAVLVVGNIIFTAIRNKSNNVATCMEGATVSANGTVGKAC